MQPDLEPANQKPSRARNISTVLAGFVVLFIAIAGVTMITNRKNADEAASIATVTITDHGFEPGTIAVKAGTRIVWESGDHSLHQVVANPYPSGTTLASLRSSILSDDQTYSFTATKTGNFAYHDQLNPTINGTLVVHED